MINIIDNQLPESLLNDCIKDAEYIEQYGVLHYAGDSSNNLDCFKYSWHFFHHENNKSIENQNINLLWGEIKKHLPSNIKLHRGYVNAHTYGTEDTIHEDDVQINNGVSIIVYLCRSWYPEWFGQTMFFSSLNKQSNEIVQSVLPKYNRFIIFDKKIPHCVSPLSRRFFGVRLTCMFKVEILNVPS